MSSSSVAPRASPPSSSCRSPSALITALQASWISLVLIVVWLFIAAAASKEYVRSFRRSLRQRAVDTDLPINVADVTTLEILVQSLGSSDPRQVLHSLEILASHDRHHLVPPLLLHHDDAEVRLRTLADPRRRRSATTPSI